MFNNEEGCLYRLFQFFLLAALAIITGFFLSFLISNNYLPLSLPNRALQQVLLKKYQYYFENFDSYRKKYILFPKEIAAVKMIINRKDEKILQQQAFQDALVQQIEDATPYIVVSLTENMLFLKQKDKILRSAKVATGKNELLTLKGHQYHFFTPRTIFTVEEKIEDPVWVMPDWAFHEQGLNPPQDIEKRKVQGILGKYALILQNSYMIHGTIDSQDLGKYITHGCIRMGASDLKALYSFIPIGTKVFIY